MSDNLEHNFKKRLAEKGILYFGPVAKHYLQDPSRGYPPKAVPHTPRQQPHGRRPGQRSLMTGIRALARRNPDLNLPSWNEMLRMEHKQVLAIFEEHYGEVKPAEGADQKVVRVVENKPGDAKGGFRREEERANTDAQAMPAAGKAGENLKVNEFPVSRMLDGKKPKRERRGQVPRTRVPNRDVADVRERGFQDERELGNEAGRPKGQRGKGNFPREGSEVGEPREDGPVTRAGRQAARDRGAQNRQVRRLVRQPARQPEPVLEVIPELKDEVQQLKDAGVSNEIVNMAGRVRDIDSDKAKAFVEVLRRAANIKDEPDEKKKALRDAANAIERKIPNTEPDRPATRAAREAGVPKKEQFDELKTPEQVPFRDFEQNAEDVNAALNAAKAEAERAAKDGNLPNRLRVAGRYLDYIAFNDKADRGSLDQEKAERAASRALDLAAEKHEFEIPEKKRDEWIKNLAQQYMIRRRGRPEGEDEEKRARQMIREEKQRDEEGNFQRVGRVRPKLERPERVVPEAVPIPEAILERMRLGGRLARNKSDIEELEQRLKEAEITDRKPLREETEDDGQEMAVGINASDMEAARQDGKRILLKKGAGDGYQEIIGYKIAQELEVDNFHPVAVERDGEDGAVIEGVGNNVAGYAGVGSWDEMLDAIQNKFIADGEDSGVAKAMAEEAAKRLTMMDYVMANSDRHHYNARVQVDENGKAINFWFIDDGHMGDADKGSIVPRNNWNTFKPERGQAGVQIVDGNYRMQLSVEMRRLLEKLDEQFFKQHEALFRTAKNNGLNRGAYEERMLDRIREALKNGYFEWR